MEPQCSRRASDRRVRLWATFVFVTVLDMDSIQWLDRLFAEERIALRRGPLLSTTPERIAPSADRIAGMLLGLAIGDALENTTEGLPPSARAAWAALSRSCHHHIYELPPTAEELARLAACVERFTAHLATLPR